MTVDAWMSISALKLFIETIDSVDYSGTEHTEPGFPLWILPHWNDVTN